MTEFFYDWFGLNTFLFSLLNINSATYGRVMLALSGLGEHTRMRIYVPIIAIIVLGRLAFLKMRGWTIEKKQWHTEFALIVTLVMGYAAYGLVVGVLKTLVAAPRPFMIFNKPGTMFYWGGPYPEVVDYYTSFPSGHAATAAFLLTALWPRLPKIGQYFGLLLLGLICLSRVAIGMHFPADVLGGALIGWGVAVIVRRYVYRMLKVEYRVARPPK